MTDDDRTIFLDTNVLIRATIETAPFHTEVYNAVHHLWANRYRIWISLQVLREYAAVLTRPQTYLHPIPSATLVAQMRTLVQRFNVADETEAVAEALWTLLETIPIGGKQVHDANIVATMKVHHLTKLFTFNTADFARFASSIVVMTLEEILDE